jgi:hypothetical protein
MLVCFMAQAEKDHIALAWDDAQDWGRIDDIRLRYYYDRLDEVFSIEIDEPDLVDGTAALLRGACAQLKAALDHEDHSPWFWQAFAANAPELTRESLTGLAQKLDQRVEILNRRIPRREVKIGEAGSKLIARLGEMFRDKGLRPTAPNPTGTMPQKTAERIKKLGHDPAKADLLPAFPALVREVMVSLPEDLWPKDFWATQYAQSSAAFLKAINRALRPPCKQ